MVTLVFGSPCSGKSHYIKEHMADGDVVCDVDLIYSAISGKSPHDADLYVHEMALKIYGSLLDMVRNREGGWKNAYVVSIANTSEKLKEDMERVNADECIFIDTPYDVCMERANERPFYFKYLIQEWFELQDFNGNEVINSG